MSGLFECVGKSLFVLILSDFKRSLIRNLSFFSRFRDVSHSVESDEHYKERWSAYKERKSDTCKEKGSQKTGSETGEQQK